MDSFTSDGDYSEMLTLNGEYLFFYVLRLSSVIKRKEEEIKKISVRSGLITVNRINAIAVGRNHNIGLHNAVIFVCDNGFFLSVLSSTLAFFGTRSELVTVAPGFIFFSSFSSFSIILDCDALMASSWYYT